MQVFEDVLASGQLGLRMYSKSTTVEICSRQWEFCHYQQPEKRILRHISLQPSLWVFLERAISFKKGFHSQRVKKKRHHKTWHLMYVSKALAIPFLQWKEHCPCPGVAEGIPSHPCTLQPAWILPLTAMRSFTVFLKETLGLCLC